MVQLTKATTNAPCSLHPRRLQYSLAALACGDGLLRMRCVWYASVHMLTWMYKESKDQNANEPWTSRQPYCSRGTWRTRRRDTALVVVYVSHPDHPELSHTMLAYEIQGSELVLYFLAAVRCELTYIKSLRVAASVKLNTTSVKH